MCGGIDETVKFEQHVQKKQKTSSGGIRSHYGPGEGIKTVRFDVG